MGILSALQSAWDWVCDLFSDGPGKVRRAATRVMERICGSPESRELLERSGLGTHTNVSEAMRNPATRDAAVYDVIDSFYQNRDDTPRMMEYLSRHGFNNGRTTHAYVINSGEGSVGRGESRHQAVLITDETQSPPQVTLAFRGMNPMTEGLSVVGGMLRVATGNPSSTIQQDADQFWRSAEPGIRRAIEELQARHPHTPVQVTLAGHSYGADGAARMIPHLTEIVRPEQVRYVGYGGIQSMTREDRDRLTQALGQGGNARATQYMVNNDWVSWAGWGYTMGTRRDLPTNSGHLNYAATGNVTALMAAVEDQMQRTPEQAREIADRLIADLDRDSSGTLARLANYARDMAGSVGLPAGSAPRSATPSPTPA